jgi:hypothetical protein
MLHYVAVFAKTSVPELDWYLDRFLIAGRATLLTFEAAQVRVSNTSVI